MNKLFFFSFLFLGFIFSCSPISNSSKERIILDIGKIENDTTSIYQIRLIEEQSNRYIIHATREDYYFRIISDKKDHPDSGFCDSIIVGNKYQLDIRDLQNQNIRYLYSKRLGDMGECEFIQNSEFLCAFNENSKTQYSQVINLRGLCLTPLVLPLPQKQKDGE